MGLRHKPLKLWKRELWWLIMAKRFVVLFAATGDKTTTPDATDPAGAISYSQGWGSQYQLANTDPSYRPVGRQEMNGVLNDITGAIAEIQVQGFPTWVPVTGLVTPYPINAWVRYNNAVWRSLIANNSDTPVEGASWTSATNVATPSIVIVSTSGNFTVPSNVYFLDVQLWGGGGGGGAGSSSGSAGGGGAGGYSRKVMAVTPGQVIAAVVGSGGAINGGSGTTTSFNGISATGGSGGTNNASGNGGNGGSGSGGTVNLTGGAGGSGAGVTTVPGGAGGGCPGGGGGSSNGALGVAGSGATPGGAGGGGGPISNGGAGGAGLIVIKYEAKP